MTDTKLDKISDILDTLIDDALEHDSKQRFYKMGDKDLLSAINVLSEYFLPKEQRTNIRDSSKAPEKLNFK